MAAAEVTRRTFAPTKHGGIRLLTSAATILRHALRVTGSFFYNASDSSHMRTRILGWLLAMITAASADAAQQESRVSGATSSVMDLRSLPEERRTQPTNDWLVVAPPQRAGVFRSQNGKEIVLNNGLLLRAWRLSPNAATVAFDNL